MVLSPLNVFTGSLLAYMASGVTTSTATQIPLLPLIDTSSVICREISESVSLASSVFFPGSEEYSRGIKHDSPLGTQESMCSFEPGTPKDVGIALQILGRSRIPFAIKGGGQGANPGFSSTPGVHITLNRFSNVKYDTTTRTVEVGAGLHWDDVYAALEPYGVNVAGTQDPGIGVGGSTLGGGYSWHTNQYGLIIDNVEAFELVLPNGAVTKVDASQSDLFFALKGGYNNFGVVTKFVYRTFPQTHVWGGTIIYKEDDRDQLIRATTNFVANNNDPKANIIASFRYAQIGGIGVPYSFATLFYDAPSPPDGLFNDFLTSDSDSKVFTRSFLSHIKSTGEYLAVVGYRYALHSVSVPGYSENFLEYIADQSLHWGAMLPINSGYVSFTAVPLLPSAYNQNTTQSAWPGSRTFFSPFNIAFRWIGDGSTDEAMLNGLKQSAANIRGEVSLTESGQLSVYGNFAAPDTPLEAIYGENLGRLRRIAKEVDPGNVMQLAGGFKF